MDKLDILFIRACKVNNNEQRLKSLYRRFYLIDLQDVSEIYIINKLARLCDKYCSFKTIELVSELSPDYIRWKFDKKEYTFNEKCLKVLIMKIRFLDVSKLDGFIVPAFFRNFRNK